MIQSKAQRLMLSAMLAAMICAATLAIRIPLPGGGGYANLGDGILLTSACLLPPGYAVMAACVGSGLADVLSGYAMYVPGTVVIKGGMALIVALVCAWCAGRRFSPRAAAALRLAAMIMAELVMAGGYLLYDAAVLSYGAAALAALPGNAVQGAVGVMAALALHTLIGRQKNRRT